MRQRKQYSGPNPLSILTLDDDPIMTSTIQAYFQRSGYRVDVENDPYRAIERVRRGSYDILLLDFLMTPLCGDQVVEQIRQFNSDLFIILLTGHKSMVPPIKTIRALDIQGYYEKSDRFDQLELLVESCAKSIRQLRTIKSYRDGLSAIMDSLPRLYTLHSMEQIADTVLRTASALADCVNVVLTLDASCYEADQSDSPNQRYISRAVGERFAALESSQVAQLLQELSGQSFLQREQQLIFPLLDTQGPPMGLLSLELKTSPKDNQIQLLGNFCRQAASAICSARLHALLHEKNHQLDQAYIQLKDGYMEVISAMRRVVDAKDIYTRGHSDRVSYYASSLARFLGRDGDYCEEMRIAGLFHDIGKLSIPDEILGKESRLTDEEYDIIKTHPEHGADILSVISQFRPILPAVRYHHERIDGTGYPEGLSGQEIPEQARIIAVADTFDAMTADRQYRRGSGFRQAIEELVRCKDTQLDAQIVEAFQAMTSDPAFWAKMQEEMQDRAPCQVIPEFDQSTSGGLE